MFAKIGASHEVQLPSIHVSFKVKNVIDDLAKDAGVVNVAVGKQAIVLSKMTQYYFERRNATFKALYF
ncbi:hypothetical protein SAMN05443254_112162 [Bradyrhizobium sp. OK095]|nr:hypothetical protein SAMN05443254_112162 [Bradyrhizobium sp. OK095]